jgi:peptidyl-prolyl cis-trans isomerase C
MDRAGRLRFEQGSWIAVLGCGAFALVAEVAAQGLSRLEPAAVVATVGDEPIEAGEVNRRLDAVTRGKKIAPDALPVVQAQVLSEIVDRRLILAYARRTQSGAAAGEVDKAVAELKQRLAAQQRSLGDYLRDQAMTEGDLRRQIAWKLAWERFLAKYVTEPRLASSFEAHRREFDGTEVVASHILLRPAPGGDPQNVETLVQQAQAIREEITSGRISFEEAARKHSAGPSGKEGGRLGSIPRRGVMDEAFSRAAFALEAGQISPPVKSPFGVHLIRCDTIKPGTKSLGDARAELEEALARELFEKLARIELRHTPVRFTGKAPYFKPGTEELVLPAAGKAN